MKWRIFLFVFCVSLTWVSQASAVGYGGYGDWEDPALQAQAQAAQYETVPGVYSGLDPDGVFNGVDPADGPLMPDDFYEIVAERVNAMAGAGPDPGDHLAAISSTYSPQMAAAVSNQQARLGDLTRAYGDGLTQAARSTINTLGWAMEDADYYTGQAAASFENRVADRATDTRSAFDTRTSTAEAAIDTSRTSTRNLIIQAIDNYDPATMTNDDLATLLGHVMGDSLNTLGSEASSAANEMGAAAASYSNEVHLGSNDFQAALSSHAGDLHTATNAAADRLTFDRLTRAAAEEARLGLGTVEDQYRATPGARNRFSEDASLYSGRVRGEGASFAGLIEAEAARSAFEIEAARSDFGTLATAQRAEVTTRIGTSRTGYESQISSALDAFRTNNDLAALQSTLESINTAMHDAHQSVVGGYRSALDDGVVDVKTRSVREAQDSRTAVETEYTRARSTSQGYVPEIETLSDAYVGQTLDQFINKLDDAVLATLEELEEKHKGGGGGGGGVEPEPFEFSNLGDIDAGQPARIDPPVAIGYDYEVLDGPNFHSVRLPSIGDDLFELWLKTGSDWVYEQDLAPEELYTFDGDGENIFRILGIDPDLTLNPGNPIVFITELSFVDPITDTTPLRFTMTPIVTDYPPTASGTVPEPGTLFLLGTGLLWLAAFGRRKRA